MSGADKIIEKILNDAKEASEAAVESARSSAEQQVAKAIAKAEKQAQEQVAKSEDEAKEIKRRMMSVAELEGRKNILSCKQEVIEETFEAAKDTLSKLAVEPYRELVKKMLLENVQGEDEISIAEKDKNVFSDEFIAEINDELAKAGKGSVKVSSTYVDITGGFILSSSTMESNCSFEALLRMVRQDEEPQVAAILFQ